MSKLCWIPLSTWTSLAAHHRKTWIDGLIDGRQNTATLPPVVDWSDREDAKRSFQLTHIKQCVCVFLLLLKRLTRDDNWELDVEVGGEVSKIDERCLKPEDIALQNISVEVMCQGGQESEGQDFLDIAVSREGCTINGVQLEMNEIQAIVYTSSNVEFVQSIRNRPLSRNRFMTSRHQFLRQLGLLFFQLLSQVESFLYPRITTDRKSVSAENDSNTLSRIVDDYQINNISKLMRRSKLDAYEKELLDADVPESICRVVTDLLNSGEDDEETSFTSLIDVLNELQDIIADRPDILFYQTVIPRVGNTTHEVKIDFGNVVYGREVETNRILELAALPTELFMNRIILIGGNGGEGKTFMIEGVKNHLVERSGWVHLGVKFDRLMHNSPLSAIASAFEGFFSSLFRTGDQESYLSTISASLLQFLSPSMTVMLCNLMPYLRRLFPDIMRRVISDDDLTELAKESDGAEQNQFDEILSDLESSRSRLHYSIRRLVHAISSVGRPLLFVLDNLQWADQASLDLITSVMAEWDPVPFDENTPIARVLFVGLYRSDVVDHNHILSTLYFPAFKAMPTIEVHSILLPSMTKKDCNSMISYALRLPIRLTRSLADIVHAKTLGNVFYIRMFVESLVINKTLTYSLSERRWVWHLGSVKSTRFTENFAHLLTRNLQVLPETTIWALKLLSCFGPKAEESLLLLLKDHINMIDELAVAIDRNIIEKKGEVYRFAHDILVQGLYDMMSRIERSNYHLFIGLELIKAANKLHGSHVRPVTFIAIDQINRAKMLGNPQLSYSIHYANLNLKAAESSMSVSDFASALSYAEHGISFLKDNLWDEYTLSLSLFETASKSCSTSYQGDKMQCFLDEIFMNAKCLQDRLASHQLLIESLVLMGNEGHAVDSAFALLEELGETSPKDVSPAIICNEVLATKNALQRYSDNYIINSPRVSDWNINARMRVLGSILPALFTSQPQYHLYVACRIINLSIQHGVCSDSPFGLVAYANSLLNTNVDEAYRLGKLSISLQETFESTDKRPRLQGPVYSFLAFFHEPLQAVVNLLRKNYKDALLAGDTYYAYMSIIFYTRFSMMCGHNLSVLEKECKAFTTQLTRWAKPSACLTFLGLSEAIIELSGSPTIPFSQMPDLNISTEEDYLERLESRGMSAALQAGYFNALFVDFWYKKYDEAAGWAKKYRCRNQNRLLDVYHAFYEGLSAFQLARNPSNKCNWIEVGQLSIALFKQWMKHSVWNFESKLLLLQAELHFCLGNKESAIDKYQRSIKAAQENGFVHEEGLAFELLGSLYMHYGDLDEAKLQIESAHTCYKKWGAFGIIELHIAASTCHSQTNDAE